MKEQLAVAVAAVAAAVAVAVAERTGSPRRAQE